MMREAKDCQHLMYSQEYLFGNCCPTCGMIICYADDATLVLSSNSRVLNQDRLVEGLDLVEEYLTANRLLSTGQKLTVLAVLTVLTVPTLLTVLTALTLLTVLTLFIVLTVLTVLTYQTLEFFYCSGMIQIIILCVCGLCSLYSCHSIPREYSPV